ncbi:hypothetical protein CsSME_00046962 [Camellia sinensis var. sinensis]
MSPPQTKRHALSHSELRITKTTTPTINHHFNSDFFLFLPIFPAFSGESPCLPFLILQKKCRFWYLFDFRWKFGIMSGS